jgi:hypothetical protein
VLRLHSLIDALRRAALGAALLPSLLLAPAALAAEKPPLIDRPGTWTLTRLGTAGAVLHERASRPKQQLLVHFRVPRGARQGRGSWYLVRLHFAVDFRPNAAPGTLEIFGRVNGETVASIVFDVENINGITLVTSDSVGLVTGHVRASGAALHREQLFENYLGYHDLAPGTNTLALGLSQDAFPLLEAVRIYADSGLELTRYPPASPRLSLHVAERTIRVGQPFHLVFEIHNDSGGRIPRATVSLARRGGFTITRRVAVLHWDPATRSLHGAFELRPLRAGRLPLVVDAAAALKELRAVSAVSVLPRRGGGTSTALLAGVAAAGAAAILILIGLARRQSA